MFGWKNYGFVEPATEENLNGKGNVWKLIQQWKPFTRYIKTDLINEKATGNTIATIDIVRCPKWVGRVISKQLQLMHPERKSSWYECQEDDTTGLIDKNSLRKLDGEP